MLRVMKIGTFFVSYCTDFGIGNYEKLIGLFFAYLLCGHCTQPLYCILYVLLLSSSMKESGNTHTHCVRSTEYIFALRFSTNSSLI